MSQKTNQGEQNNLKIRRRDLPLVLFCGISSLIILRFFGAARDLGGMLSGGFRRVNVELIKSKIKQGKLAMHEAMFYSYNTKERVRFGSSKRNLEAHPKI